MASASGLRLPFGKLQIRAASAIAQRLHRVFAWRIPLDNCSGFLPKHQVMKTKYSAIPFILTFAFLAFLPDMQAGVGVPPADGDSGSFNNAFGDQALFANISGRYNTAVGDLALQFSTGDYNTALGANAGTDPDILSNNIYNGDAGFAGDTNVIAIGGIAASGTDYTATYIGGIYGASVSMADAAIVYVDTDGHLGTVLKDANGNPATAPVRRSKGAHPQAMINRKVAELQATVAQQQQKQIETLTAKLKEQAAQIQKVSAQFEMSKAAPKVVANKP
jgi:hypothetical protein